MPTDRDPFYNLNIFSSNNQNYFNNFGRGPWIIPVEFGQISSGSRQEVVLGSSFPYIIQCKIVTPGEGSNVTQGA